MRLDAAREAAVAAWEEWDGMRRLGGEAEEEAWQAVLAAERAVIVAREAT